GVDHTNPFFDPTGYAYPPGYPKGNTRFTSPKVIVARSFPGPTAGRRGRLPVDRRASFHGTHVAGIAAGNAGITAPPGPDHPAVGGLSGVAPRAWVGNYRVFNVPTPLGYTGNTPEIVAAFEAAVADGMDVINFSGGGTETDPANDAMIETVRNVVAAGVVPVIAAGNDRDEYGMGSIGSPGTAPDAISVAAVSNSHVFGPALGVTAPDAPAALRQIPYQGRPPASWGAQEQTLVDVNSLPGRDGTPVDPYLCGPGRTPNEGTPLVRGSLRGVIALALRGRCTFFSKALRAYEAGAVGLILIDNRPGEANGIPVPLPVPAGMISDLDGRQLRDFMRARGGRTQIRVERTIREIDTGRSGIVTSFSSGGPTAFRRVLKPDLSAPGGQILSSTLREFAGSDFAVFDGTSMAAPHVAGAAALLLERHPGWTPLEVKSALVSTAGAAWANTARTNEAPVVLGGGGLVNVPRANDPRIFTNPTSLSLGELHVTHGAATRGVLLRISDAGGGAGTWQVQLRPQSATAGASIDVPPTVIVPPGGEGHLAVVARADADAVQGEDFGFVVLRRAGVTRRIPYDFFVARPGLASVPAVRLKRFQLGDTLKGTSRVEQYCCPSAPFGHPPNYVGAPMREDGAEKLYVTQVNRPVVNLGVSVISASENALIHPWVLGSRNENDVQGAAGTPVNVNPLMFDYRLDVGAAATVFPRQQQFFVSVDSGQDPFTGQSLGGRYLLRSWVNDLRPPKVRLLSTRVAAGRPLLLARAVDRGSGVDPYSLVIAYRRVLVGAAAYDPGSGVIAFPLPGEAPALRPGRTRAILVASDYQEAKNVATISRELMPNTAFRSVRIRVRPGPAIAWLAPGPRACVTARQPLVVQATSTRSVTSVRFYDGKRRIATVRRGPLGLYSTTWKTRAAKRGRHVLRAVVRDRRGRTDAAALVVRVCR
ncbi:MAG: S8 family serine peptidase, partial [Actinomycetota bacterium]|nr:S8 family serine peptidase [Actinomycetota bacterium]